MKNIFFEIGLPLLEKSPIHFIHVVFVKVGVSICPLDNLEAVHEGLAGIGQELNFRLRKIHDFDQQVLLDLNLGKLIFCQSD